MRVIALSSPDWILFGEGQALFLEVHCRRGVFAHSVLLRLDAEETRGYGSHGREYIASLARAIQVAAAGDGAPYRARDVAALYSDKVAGAMEAWEALPPEQRTPT